MKRYLAKERPATPVEQFATYRARVMEAESDLAQAAERLHQVMHGELPTMITEYVEVKPGEPGYDDAPVQNSMIVMGQEMRFEIASEPWRGLIKPGKYPEGLGDL